MNGSVELPPEQEIDQILANLRRRRPSDMSELNEILLALRQKMIRIPQQSARNYKEQLFNILWFQAFAARNVRLLEEADPP